MDEKLQFGTGSICWILIPPRLLHYVMTITYTEAFEYSNAYYVRVNTILQPTSADAGNENNIQAVNVKWQLSYFPANRFERTSPGVHLTRQFIKVIQAT